MNDIIVINTKAQFDMMTAADQRLVVTQLTTAAAQNADILSGATGPYEGTWPIIRHGVWPLICRVDATVGLRKLKLLGNVRIWDAAEVEIIRTGTEWAARYAPEDLEEARARWADAEYPDVLLARFTEEA